MFAKSNTRPESQIELLFGQRATMFFILQATNGSTMDTFSFGHTYVTLCKTKMYQVGPTKNEEL
jgi:hypothetical protein